MTAADDLAHCMERVARALLGEPNARLSKATELRYGTNGSLKVDLASGGYYDFEADKGGGVLDLIAREKSLTGADAFKFMRDIGCNVGNGGTAPPARKLIATFDYHDADGTLVFQVLRYEPKQFIQRRPDANLGWDYHGGPPLLYRLPEVIEAVALNRPVFVCEGEAKVDALAKWNVPATCCAGGAKKWKPEHSENLRGANVIVLPDNDAPGRDHSNVVGTALQGIAARVRVLELPGLAEKGDVVDWIDAGGTVEQFWQLVETTARPWAPYAEEPAPLTTPPLALTYFDDCGAFVEKRSLLKGVIARGETSAWIAPPGYGKSALLTEISVACAAAIDWRGHKAKEPCGVVILALERADLFKRRLWVYRQRDGLTGLPIAVSGAVIDLLSGDCVELIVGTVREAESHFGHEVGLVVIDTYAKGIAAGGGDEDKARDQNRAAANLRHLHGRLDIHIALVGHTGKDETRGARGSNAHLGDVDVMIQISGETIHVAQVIKGNDQAERVVAQFRLEQFEIARDADGDAIITTIVSAENIEAPDTGSRAKTKLAPVPKAALRELYECIADGLTAPIPPDEHVPPGVTCVRLDIWRDRLIKTALINPKGSYREQFKRIHVTLKNAGLVGVWSDVVWPSHNVTSKQT